MPAAYSKRRTRTPRRSAPTAAILRPWLAVRPPGKPVFVTMPTIQTAKMTRIDLEAAGIPAKDDLGRVIDFQSLRHTYINSLVRGGASAKTAQALARHSTPNRTIGHYSHSRPHDLPAALETLSTANRRTR